MTTSSQRPSAWRLFLGLLLSPLLAVYGLVTLVRGVGALVGRLLGAQHALATTLHCPNGHVNPTTGRFECAHCHATYHGWVGRCALCGAGAGWIECERCGVGIRLPWVSR
jgi:hypothetical protein